MLPFKVLNDIALPGVMRSKLTINFPFSACATTEPVMLVNVTLPLCCRHPLLPRRGRR